MKKSLLKANIIIVVMLVCLVGLTISNSIAVQTATKDSRVIYNGNTANNNVCFMFNVYQGEQQIKDILDILDIYNVKTTFFIGGSWATTNIDIIKEIYSRGHELANHGFYHKQQDNLDFASNKQEIDLCHKLIQKNLGVQMNLFAPPSGAYNITTVDAATTLNYKTIMWTHDTIDWRDKDADLIYKRATKNLSNGDLVLMHPTQDSVKALTNILAYAINNGYNPTTVSNCLN